MNSLFKIFVVQSYCVVYRIDIIQEHVFTQYTPSLMITASFPRHQFFFLICHPFFSSGQKLPFFHAWMHIQFFEVAMPLALTLSYSLLCQGMLIEWWTSLMFHSIQIFFFSIFTDLKKNGNKELRSVQWHMKKKNGGVGNWGSR